MFAKVMFLHLSVSHSVHTGGGCLPQCMLGYTPPPPPEQTPPGSRHPLCSACWEIRATSRRYTCWNAYLFPIYLHCKLHKNANKTHFLYFEKKQRMVGVTRHIVFEHFCLLHVYKTKPRMMCDKYHYFIISTGVALLSIWF